MQNDYKEAIRYLREHDSVIDSLTRKISIYTRQNNDKESSLVFLVRQIASQMLSKKAAEAIIYKLINLCNGDLSISELEKLTDEDLRGCGFSAAKVKYIRGLQKQNDTDPLYFNRLNDLSNQEIIDELRTLPGIGVWTAKMYLLFYL